MSRCTTCSRDWPPELSHCPEDGSTLVPVVEGVRGSVALEPSGGIVLGDDELPAGYRVGEYVVEAKIGEGGMGTVYASVHPVIGKKAAVKVIKKSLCSDRSAVDRFITEARSVNQIGHINIVDVFSLGVLPDGRSYFVMEWLQGESLGDRMEHGLSAAEAVQILDQIGDALEAAHEKGIVHRDLKPDNVFLVNVRGNRLLVKLLDFGIAKLVAAESKVERTRTGTMMGTPAYISPEQARGRSVDHRTDIYALGCMAFELLTGQLPFEADNAMDMIAAHLAVTAPRMSTIWPDVPPALDDIVAQMVTKNPEERPSLTEVRQVLQQTTAAFSGVLHTTLSPRGATPVPGVITPMTSARTAQRPVAEAFEHTISAPSTMMPVVVPPKRRGAWIIAGVTATVLLAVAAVVVIAGGSTEKRSNAASTTTPASSSDTKSEAATDPAANATVTKADDTKATPPLKDDPGTDKTTAEIPATTPAAAPDAGAAVAPPTAPAEGTLVVQVNVDDARIVVDGAVAAEAARTATVTLAPGDHVVEASAPGRKAETQHIDVAAGATATAELHLSRDRHADKGKDKAKTDKTDKTTVASDTKATDTKATDTKATDTKATDTKAADDKKRKDKDYTIDPFKH